MSGLLARTATFLVLPITVLAHAAASPALSLQAARESVVTGTITTDDGTPPPFQLLAARVSVLGEHRAAGDPSGPIDRDWSFSVPAQPGMNRLRLKGLPDGWMLKSVWLADANRIDSGFNVTAGERLEGLRVVVTRRVGTVAGTVVDGGGRPIRNATIIVFPQKTSLWVPTTRFILTARSDVNGRFTASGLPPGSYQAVARISVEDGQWLDPAYLRGIADDASRFELAEEGAVTVTLRVK